MKNGQIQPAIEKLLALEKQTRQASDLASTSRIIIAIVTICKNSGDWSLLNEQVLLISKKHGQLKQAITKMVQAVMGFLDDVENLDTKLTVIETLRTVTEGKVRLYKGVLGLSGARLTTYRYSSRLSGHALRRHYQTSSGRKATSQPPPRSSANFKSRHSVQ